MEVEVGVADDPGDAAVDDRFECLERLVDERGGPLPADDHPHGLDLDRLAHRVDVVDVLGPHPLDPRPASRGMTDAALADEALQRLPQGRPGDPEQLRGAHLVDRLPRQQTAAVDRIADLLGDEVDRRGTHDATQHGQLRGVRLRHVTSI